MTNDLQRAIRRRALPIYDDMESRALAKFANNQLLKDKNLACTASVAGKKGGEKRRAARDLRHKFVKAAYDLLSKAQQGQPWSGDSCDALTINYRTAVKTAVKNLEIAPLLDIERDTLLADMKHLGIRSKRRRPRLG